MKSRFVYKPRTTEAVQKRATQSGADWDTFFDSRFMKFTPEGGQNYIRILPPTWEDAEHFGFDYYLHSNVGPDNSQYLCLERNAEVAQLHGVEAGKCPVCEERRSLEREGATEEANVLKAAHRVGVWIIDRNNEKDGPKFWDMSWTMDKDIAALQINKRTGEALLIDDPDHGYDFEFVREGKGLNTRYIGKQISRQESPISDDDRQQEAWLEFITNHPIPDVLNFYSYDHIAKVFSGRKSPSDDNTQPETPPRRMTREIASTASAPRERATQTTENGEEEALFDNGARRRVPRQADEESQRRPRQRLQQEDEVEEEEDVSIPSSFRERMNKVNERNVRR